MNFDYSDKSQKLIDRLQAFMDEHIYPVEQEYIDAVHNNAERWMSPPMMDVLKQKAKDAG